MARARVENPSSARSTSAASGSRSRANARSSEPSASRFRRIRIRPIRSSPRVQRCTIGRSPTPSRSGSKSRTNAAGSGPSTAHTDSIDAITEATRPNARPAAMKPTTSRSSAREYRRTIWIGSSADSGWLNDEYSRSSATFKLTGGLRPAGPPIAVARGAPSPHSAPAGRARWPGFRLSCAGGLGPAGPFHQNLVTGVPAWHSGQFATG